MPQLLSIDQGTTSSRAILFDEDLRPVATEQMELPQFYPAPGLVEHDPEQIWGTALVTARAALAHGDRVAALGITNQRETTIVWERDSGRAVHRAIVWQDRRTAERCRELPRDLIRERTGLVVPMTPALGRTSGSARSGTPSSSSISALQAPRRMS